MKFRDLFVWTALAASAASLASSCKSEFSGCETTLECAKAPGAGGEGGRGGGGDGGGGGGDGGDPGTSGAPACGASCDGATPHCDEGAGACVECLESGDCAEAEAPRCEAGACVGCADGSDCAGIDGKPLCDGAAGACVECLTEADCGGKVCHPATRTCTLVDARAKHVCHPCSHDAECQEGQVCVETRYNDPSAGVVGQFCLWRRRAPAPGPAGSCGLSSRPYSRSVAVTSVDGEDVTVCELRTTTCAALLQHSQPVEGCSSPADNSACGADGFNDGLCRLNSEAEARCTYPCGGLEDCRPGFTCDVGDYCSL